MTTKEVTNLLSALKAVVAGREIFHSKSRSI